MNGFDLRITLLNSHKEVAHLHVLQNKFDIDVFLWKLYVMQTKLTLRVDDAVIRKAKKIASKRGTSVSRIFSDYISEVDDNQDLDELGEITKSMVGALGGVDVVNEKEEYRDHLESKYL